MWPISTDAEHVGHSYQINQGLGSHLLHQNQMPAVDLDGDQAQPRLGGNLLVHQSGSHQGHDLPLAGRQSIEQDPDVGQRLLTFPALAVMLDGVPDGIEHVLVAKWLGQEVDGPSLHRLH
jgi:hypothetical protein